MCLLFCNGWGTRGQTSHYQVIVIVLLICPGATWFHCYFVLFFIKDDESDVESEHNSGEDDLNEDERKQLKGNKGTVRHPEISGITTEVCLI